MFTTVAIKESNAGKLGAGRAGAIRLTVIVVTIVTVLQPNGQGRTPMGPYPAASARRCVRAESAHGRYSKR